MTAPLPFTDVDLVCEDDLDPFARETGSDLENLEQDVFHILVQDLGSNPDDLKRGVGIYNYLNGTLEESNKLPAVIEAQLNEDDRINGCHCSIDSSGDTRIVQVEIEVGAQVINLQYAWSNAGGLVSL